MDKQEFIKKIAGYEKNTLPTMELRYIVLLLPRLSWKADGEKAAWRPCTTIILALNVEQSGKAKA